MATDAQIDAARVWVGSSTDVVTDDLLDEAIDRLGSVEAAAHEVLKKRRADLLDRPSTMNVPGYSDSVVEQLKQLGEDISKLETFEGVAGLSGSFDAISTVPAERPDRRGR